MQNLINGGDIHFDNIVYTYKFAIKELNSPVLGKKNVVNNSLLICFHANLFSQFSSFAALLSPMVASADA